LFRQNLTHPRLILPRRIYNFSQTGAARQRMRPGIAALLSLGALSLGALSLGALSFGTPDPALAADLAQPPVLAVPPPPEKPFFVRIGVVGSFFDTDVAAKVVGVPVAGGNGKIASAVSAGFDAGAFILPHFSVSVGGGFPPVLSLTGTGVFAPQGVLVKAQSGLMTFTGQYHIDYFGPVRPYVGGGLGYAIVFRDISTGVIGGPRLDNNVGPVVQAGVDYAITDSIGLYIDFKKAWITQNLTGLTAVPAVPGFVPVYARIRSDPILLTAGASYRF
jgi:outer membrane protein